MNSPLLMTCAYFVTGMRVWMPHQVKKIVGRKGYGGKLEFGETWQKCNTREVGDESGRNPDLRIDKTKTGGIFFEEEDVIPFALVSFYNGTVEEVPPGEPTCTVLFLRCHKFHGTPISTIEMVDPRLYWIKSLPYRKMIAGDYLFITPETLLGKECKRGIIRQTKDFKRVLDHRIVTCGIDDLTFEKRPI